MKSLGSLDSSSLAISIRQYKLSKNKGKHMNYKTRLYAGVTEIERVDNDY